MKLFKKKQQTNKTRKQNKTKQNKHSTFEDLIDFFQGFLNQKYLM